MNNSRSTETQRYMVLDHKGNHEYNLVVIDHVGLAIRTIELYHSSGDQWSSEARGEMVLAMTDNGNGVKFDRKFKKLDYSELLYLRLILNFEHKTSNNELDRESYIVMAMNNEIHV